MANILTGSVRQSPSTIRVGAQLIDGTTGLNRWSQQYDRPHGDLIEIQSDIAASVAQALRIALRASDRAALAVGGTQNPEAQRLFLRAVEVARDATTESETQAGLALLDRTIALDPAYADAHALKSLLLASYADYYPSGVEELAALRAESARYAREAIRLAPDLSSAHLALAVIHQSDLDIARAYGEYRRAFELAPGDAQTIHYYALFVDRLGRTSEALELADQAVELDPLNMDTHKIRFQVLMGARRYADAIAYAQELQRDSPELFPWPADIAYALLLVGRLDEAERYLKLAPADDYKRLVGESVLLIKRGRGGEIEPKIARLRSLYGDAASYQRGQVYAQLGDKDRAFAALDRAWEIRDIGLFWIKVDGFLDPLRGDPRLTAIMKRMNFPA